MERCKYCDEPVRRSYSDYNYGWTHEHSGGVWCRRTMAEVEEDHD